MLQCALCDYFLIIKVSVDVLVVPVPRVSRAPPLRLVDCAGVRDWMSLISVNFIEIRFKM
jgi:hypothetical protein